MAFNRYFFKFSEILSSPFSARKRKREQAEPLSDSFSARPTKQAQRLGQPGSSQGFSHQSNTHVPEVPALTRTSLPQPADQDKEASSNQDQPVQRHNYTKTALPGTAHTDAWSGEHTKHKAGVSSQPARELQHSGTRQPDQQLPTQTELDLQRRVEATERQMAELRQELKTLQSNPAAQSQTAGGAQINLQEREQYGKLVELNKARGAQNALQHQSRQQPAADPRVVEPIVLDSAAETHVPGLAHTHRTNSQHQQHGLTSVQWPQQPQAASSQAGLQTRPPPRFGPDYSASPGFTPGFRATPPAAAYGFGSSFRSPSQKLGLRAAGGRLSTQSNPKSKMIDKLMEELSVHQPYDPNAPLPAATTQQASVSITDGVDVDAVIARAKNAQIDSKTSLKQAATKEAEMVAQHKSSIRRSQAAQSPLPSLDGKGAPTAAQPRRRTAKGQEVDGYEEEEEEEEEEDTSDVTSSEELESDLSAAFSELGRLEPVQKPNRAMLDWRDKAFAPGPDSEVLVEHTHSGVDVARKDIRTLRTRQWLNDEVMNVYMGLLQERDVKMRKLGGFPKCHFFNTFFVNKLYNDDKKYVYNNVRRWTSEMRLGRWGQPSKKITECDKLIIPVHLGCHWTCAVISLRDQEILYFDSLGGKEPEIVESLAKYVTDEYQNKCQETVDTSEWPRRSPGNIPKQMNGCDCGVFALMFAEFQARDAPFTFDQQHMEYFRVKVVADIMSQKIDIPNRAA